MPVQPRPLKGDDSSFLEKFSAELPKPRKSLELYGAVKLAKNIPNDEQDGFRFGPQTKDADIHFVTHDPATYRRGLIKRCAHEEHPSEPDLRAEFKKFCAHQISRIPVLQEGLDREQLLDEWLDNSNYNGRRKEQLRALNHAWYNNDHDILKGPQHPSRMFEMNSFIKREFYLEVKEPRIINSRSDLFKSIIGPYIHAAEHLIYDEHFIKHCKPEEVARKMMDVAKGFDLFYETDYSSFEGSFDHWLLMNVELPLFRRLFSNYPEIRRLIEKAYEIKNVLRFRRRLAASFYGSRMSGEMWTSMCNGFMNKMLVMFMARKSNANVNFLVEGDDGFIASNRELDVSIAEKLGFKLKFDTTTNPRNIAFCSLRVCGHLLVPDIKRTLAHYGSTTDPRVSKLFTNDSKTSIKKRRDYIYAKALSLLTVARGIPILQEVAMQQIRCVPNAHLRMEYVDWWEKHYFDLTSLKTEPVLMKTRKYVEKNFHIPVDRQIELEKQIRKMTDLCYDIEL